MSIKPLPDVSWCCLQAWKQVGHVVGFLRHPAVPSLISSERICLCVTAIKMLQTASAFTFRWFIAWVFLLGSS